MDSGGMQCGRVPAGAVASSLLTRGWPAALGLVLGVSLDVSFGRR